MKRLRRGNQPEEDCADQTLNIEMLRELNQGKLLTSDYRDRCRRLQVRFVVSQCRTCAVVASPAAPSATGTT